MGKLYSSLIFRSIVNGGSNLSNFHSSSSNSVATHINALSKNSMPARGKPKQYDSLDNEPLFRMKRYAVAVSMCKQMEFFGVSPDVKLIGRFSVLGKMMKLGVRPDVVTLFTLINGLCNQSKICEAVSLFDKMIGHGYRPNLIVYTTILNGLCKMEERGFEPDIIAYNTVIDSLCKNGLLNEALNLFSEVKVKGIRQDIFTCLIHAMSNSVQKETTRLLNEMMDNNISLNIFTYNTMIDAHCKEGMISEAVEIVDTMRKHGIEPNVITYNRCIDACYKEGMLSQAKYIVDTMIMQDIEPDVVTYSALIDGHFLQNQMGKAKRVLS
ncbi:putative pentatricopeptide repeat-containing protein At1g12700, mitochondrial [Gossypium hirsutum]|uniref:Pentatricopeptide repeat-containing protein At1g12700, mitochondrial n=1 Tax=Gossypium hirsutum TaxID=3635 RepID=A0ABM3AMD2_GOSHI|nr:putative pentatricopeptide repeat-containing protein At1g12700, mitochondrial [Gossypium hirsutum]